MRARIIILLSLLVAGCGTTQQVHYYSLSNFPTVVTAARPFITLEPLQLSPIVQEKNLYIVGKDNEVYFARYHQWAEPLDKGLHRAIATNLEQSTMLPVLSGSARDMHCVSVHMRVDTFSPTNEGVVRFSGRWTIYDHDKHIIQTANFNESKALQSGGYNTTVQELSLLAQIVSHKIGTYIKGTSTCK